jgi:hypothetical protein
MGQKMSGPWEKYKSEPVAASGPWSKYQVTKEPESTQGQAALEGFGQGASLGYLPQLQAAAAPLQDSILEKVASTKLGADLLGVPKGSEVEEGSYVERRDANIKRQQKLASENPMTYGGAALAGGLATGIATTGLMPSAGAATAGGRIRNAALAGAAYGGAMNPGDVEGEVNLVQAPERIENAGKGLAIGGVLGTGFEVAAKGLQSGARGVESVAAKLKKWIIEEKPDAKEIEAAAQALGFKPTPGMTTDSQVVQNLESSLSQSPSIPGMLVRGQQKKVAEGLAKGAQNLTDDASQLTKFEAGEQAKKQITENVDKRFGPSKQAFNDLRQYTKDIQSTERSVKSVANNINKIDEVAVFEDGGAASVARSVNKALEKMPSADQIKSLRTMVGTKAKAAERAGTGDAKGIWEIYHKLGRLEENTIKRGVLSSARSGPEGKRIAGGMLGQLKSAKKGYSEQMGKIQEVGSATKIKGTKSPKFFNESIDEMQAEKVADKFFNLGNAGARQKSKEVFPEAFQTLRKQRLSEIRDRAMHKGKLDPSKLIRQVDKLDDEALRDLFRDSVGTASNMKKVMDSFPDKVGPSGTPQGLMYSNIFDLAQRQVTDFGRYGAYKFLSSSTTKAIGKRLQQLPEFRSLAETKPEVFNMVVGNFARALENPSSALPKVADEKSKGEKKWADDGLKKILDHVKDPEQKKTFEGARNQMLENPKLKQLLIYASDLKPGSPAMDKVLEQIKKEQGRDLATGVE